jgi:hypothetical protein
VPGEVRSFLSFLDQALLKLFSGLFKDPRAPITARSFRAASGVGTRKSWLINRLGGVGG